MNFYILAGGHSSRMGQNKALLKVDGLTLIEKIIKAVPAGEADKIKIVTNSPEDYRFLSYDRIPDFFPGCGPISGVHAGLVDSSTPFNFFLACDLPFLSQELISEIIHQHQGQTIFGVKTEDGLQPLCTIYSKSCVPMIEKMIREQNFSLHHLIASVNGKFIEMKCRSEFFNVNTLVDWISLRRQKGEN